MHRYLRQIQLYHSVLLLCTIVLLNSVYRLQNNPLSYIIFSQKQGEESDEEIEEEIEIEEIEEEVEEIEEEEEEEPDKKEKEPIKKTE